MPAFFLFYVNTSPNIYSKEQYQAQPLKLLKHLLAKAGDDLLL